VAFGMVTCCAGLGLSESGTVPYGNGLGRTGTVTTNFEIGDIEIIHCFSPYND
jgi:hypothetical protein